LILAQNLVDFELLIAKCKLQNATIDPLLLHLVDFELLIAKCKLQNATIDPLLLHACTHVCSAAGLWALQLI
jgi:hypothetical protein